MARKRNTNKDIAEKLEELIAISKERLQLAKKYNKEWKKERDRAQEYRDEAAGKCRSNKVFQAIFIILFLIYILTLILL
jgi:nitrogen fixation/metabolism regulation signal transduction histidine kinase